MKKYYVGSGNYWDPTKWVNEKNIPCSVPNGNDDVIFDDRSDVIIGYKYNKIQYLKYKLMKLLEKITLNKFKSKEPWFKTKAKTINFNGGNVTIHNKVDFSCDHVTYIKGIINTTK